MVALIPDWTVTAAICAWVLAAWAPVPVLNMFGALPLVFWLPGVALLRFSRSSWLSRTRSHALTGVATRPVSRAKYRGDSAIKVFDMAVSTVLSAAITIAAGLLLALATDHVARIEMATILAGLTVVVNMATDLMSPPIGHQSAVAPRTRGLSRLPGWVVPTSIACCLVAALLGYLSWRLYESPIPGQSFAALSLVDQHNDKIVQVINNESTTMRFRLTVSQGRSTLADENLQLAAGSEYKLILPKSIPVESEIARLMIEPGNRLYRTIVF